MKKMFFLMLTLLVWSVAMNAQVTIGSLTTPDKGSLLQLREEMAEPDLTGANIANLENASKGLLFPRVALRAFDLLDPLYGTATENPDKTWTDAATDEDKLRATGMVVFNVNPNTKGLGIGLYVWNMDQWIKVSGDQSDASASITPVRCEDIMVSGTYTQGVPVDGTHFITLTLINVERPGRYSISGSSGNGYNFYAEGVVLDKGSTTIKLPCQGIPRVGGQSDNITFAGIEMDGTCITTISVEEGAFTLSGIITEVAGKYQKKTALGATNKIHLNVNISETREECSISAPKLNGIEFQHWTGTLVAGTNTITLEAATGAQPTSTTDFSLPITIHAGSQNVLVNARIPITLPKMTYALIGSDGTYSWNNPQRKKALTGGNAFGPNGIVKIDEFGLLTGWSFTSMSMSGTGAGKKLKEELDKYEVDQTTATLPDIILFFAYSVDGNNNEFYTTLARYINIGGCVIYGAADDTTAPVNRLLQDVFEDESVLAANQIAGTVLVDNAYQIENLPNDPVVNGPFGNLSNLYWGEDNGSSANIIVTNLPSGGIQICSAWNANGKISQNKDYSMVWYAPNKKFFYFGDTCGAGTVDWGDAFPSYYDNSTGLPKSKPYGPTPRQTTYNAALELNAVAWAIRAAMDEGVNYK
ncbi:hypothetical protein FACS189440_02730 [Bacteroidia bacterium]|nr:hypothetical protein FACS189423_10940 [Bacteroidia bacterium]GHT45885.1 hypothetical protein FACS189440_02730 [Bacteroidia bacterium]